MRRSSFSAILSVAAFSLLNLSTPALAQSANVTPEKAAMLIFDASGSMWGQLDGGITKIEVARDVMGQFFSTRDAAIPLGVIAYGHNRRGDCADIEVIAQTGVQDAASLSQRLTRINPRGMTPISESLRLAAGQIPPTAEEADIILVTDGLETCDADPCAVAAQLANEGIKIRAHVVGFGLTEQEAEALACVPDQTGGRLLRPQSGTELADALNQIAAAEPIPEPEPPMQEAFFDIGPKAEAGHTYRISYHGTARPADYAGFTRRGEGSPDVSPSYGVIGGGSTANNPFSRQAPQEPGEYDLILLVTGQGIIARQPVEVVAASNGFDPIGSVEPGKRFQFTWRGPDRPEQRVVIAQPGDPAQTYEGDWGYSLSKNGRMGLRAPAEQGIYELRYLSADRKEIMFFREFGVGVPYEDVDLTTSDELAVRAAAATQAAPGQDALPMVLATFRLPDGFPEVPLSWSAVPLDPDMSPEAWAPQDQTFVAQGAFEPGRYEVSTMGAGEVEFRGVVEIVPGQSNDFVIPLVDDSDDEASATTLAGPWQVIGVPPYQVQAGADQLVTLALEQAQPNGPIGGSWTAGEKLAGPQVAGREGMFTTATRDGDALRMTFTVGEPIPAPMTLYLTPYGIGYAGSLSSGAQRMSVVMWPGGYLPPSLAEMREAVHGPAPSDFVDMSGTAPVRSDGPSQDTQTVRVRLLTPFEIGGKRVQWSAIRTDTPVSDVAFAMNDFEQMLIVDLAPGTYAVEGVNEAEGIFLADAISVTVGGNNSFEIPVAKDGERGSAETVHGEDLAFACTDAPAGCEVRHEASGISLTLPNNWSMGEPYFYETAGGVRAGQPTVTFFTEDFGKVVSVELNPRQWIQSSGPCRSVGTNQLCMFGGQGMTSEIGFEGIASSLQVTSLGSDDATAAELEAVIPIDLGGRDPQRVLRSLFGNRAEH
jgi:hypothetical protein